jgi:hypothetical protein
MEKNESPKLTLRPRRRSALLAPEQAPSLNSVTGNVVALHPTKAAKASEQKWGLEVMKLGFSIVPSLLLRAQKRLSLNPTQLAVLLQLADYWWDAERKPFPSKQALSDRLGISPRQVQRYIADLEEMKLVKRIERRALHKGKLSNQYDMSGLVKRLQELAPEFRDVERQAKEARQGVARPGLRRRTISSTNED